MVYRGISERMTCSSSGLKIKNGWSGEPEVSQGEKKAMTIENQKAHGVAITLGMLGDRRPIWTTRAGQVRSFSARKISVKDREH